VPKRAITQLFLDRISLPKAGRIEYWDTHQKGLCLRLSATGARSWITMYRVNGKQVRETLGSLAQIPKVDEARRRALASMQKARTGINPVEERRHAKARVATNTFAAAVERYLAQCERDLRPKTVSGYRQLFEHDVLPRWGDRPLSEITKGDILELLQDKAARRDRPRKGTNGGSVIQANRLLKRLKTFFSWCADHDLITGDPTAGVRKPGSENARDRVLTDDEIRAFWAATGSLDAKRRDAPPFGTLFRLLLLTAQRKSEVTGMRWSEIREDVWHIPGSRTKNGKPHFVHLSDMACEVLNALPRIEGRDLIFSGNGVSVTSGFGRAKLRLDKLMVEALRDEAGSDQIELPPFVIHDLRRTATTGMARLGIAPHVADRVLNHTAGTIRGVAAVYNRFEYLPERKAALDAWGRFVEGLVRPGAAKNVVPMRRG
jgi:integrase